MNPNITHAAPYSERHRDVGGGPPESLKHSLNLTGLLGLTPGHSEPKLSNFQRLLLPLGMELREAFELGVITSTPNHREGDISLPQ